MKCCKGCGTELPDQAMFCRQCGMKQPQEKEVKQKQNHAVRKILIACISAAVIMSAVLLTPLRSKIQTLWQNLGQSQASVEITPEPTEAPEEYEVGAYVVQPRYVSWADRSFRIPYEGYSLCEGQIEGQKACAIVADSYRYSFSADLDDSQLSFEDWVSRGNSSNYKDNSYVTILTDEEHAKELMSIAESIDGRTYIHVTSVYDSNISWYGYLFTNDAGEECVLLANQRSDDWCVLIEYGVGTLNDSVLCELLEAFA